MSKHRKHTKLTRRNNGNYANNEIAILGVKCSIITDLVQKTAKKLQKTVKIAYLDASHNNEIVAPSIDTYTFHSSGNLDANCVEELNPFNARIQLSQYDLVFINGNHYQGEKQILILDNEKEASVLKRLDQLTNIQFVIKMSDDSKYFDFLEEKYPHIKNLKCYQIDEIDKISNHINNLIQENIAPVQSLILAGGLSSRMGTDKGLLDYHGMPQREYLYEQLSKIFLHYNEGQKGVYYSARQHQDISGNSIVDKFKGLGPFGAICSAFQENPNTAWFVIATDVPFVNNKIIHTLLKHRNPKKIATTVKGKGKEFPEPLITIWEPKAYPILLSYLAQGYSCPRKVLINSDVEIVEIDDYYIQNINTPQEFEQAKKELNK
ncbi:molybdenum cofactor guanylyltransferase [Urechidicola croceus]|uniref:Molybdenum cofactor guanylyltransferase n=1 Tax=Urechidicola croceus TaxID=1850246 RepID=A0A1D8P8G5_9FLAO|nr:NTP transferase domain-containing protein [Urechidicola croceus]AOW20874.1 molybdenum cofactor guanylyltransferase [Urechidicola croceus]